MNAVLQLLFLLVKSVILEWSIQNYVTKYKSLELHNNNVFHCVIRAFLVFIIRCQAHSCITLFCVHIYLSSVTVLQDPRGTFKGISP